MSAKLTLYAAPGTCSLATAIALEEAGADYEMYRVDFPGGEQRSASYLAKNPKGRVPALGTPEGVLSENVALLAYVAQTHPQAKLAPADPFHFAEMQAVNSYLSSTVHVNHAHNRRGYRWSDDPAVIENLKIKVPQNMNECMSIFENHLLKGPWVMGEQFTTADGYLYNICTWLPNDGVDITQYPRLNDHFKRMGERPAVKRAREKNG
ncbi:glutathione S-transferase family protein [Aestuariivirga litoralis]|uniref:glutathione S-transferase family protein n=1 Tax=Aestuariivirga litoralis TaxID=2650924 RepID=UPI001FEE467E|nr:glutathione S-transferase family protein [Aestuariivirga litoralis]MBG1231243.1 glutathione S-transferase family protein [Aestuariivirga litoralis]